MNLTTRRLHIYSISILVLLSLFVSPVAACVCSHHEEVETAEVSHHYEEHDHDHADAAGYGERCFDASDECVCVSPAPKAAAKSESLKLKKQFAVIAAVQPPVTFATYVILIPEFAQTASPFAPDPYYGTYLSRGPPAS